MCPDGRMIRRMPKILNFVGTTLVLFVIVVMIPLTLPKLFGYKIYSILSESMEPVYPVGSAVFVKPAEAEQVKTGDPIVFTLGAASDMVVAHRIFEVDEASQTFITKGDANNAPDPSPVSFDRLIGKITFCVPHLGRISQFVHSINGIATGILLFAAALILWTVADILKKRKNTAESK